MSAYEDRPNKALIVIDVQNGVVDFSRDRNVVVAKIAGLVDRARTAGVKVIWVQHSEDDMPIDSEYWQPRSPRRLFTSIFRTRMNSFSLHLLISGRTS
jgi:nicotinamidase-related amidase